MLLDSCVHVMDIRWCMDKAPDPTIMEMHIYALTVQ